MRVYLGMLILILVATAHAVEVDEAVEDALQQNEDVKVIVLLKEKKDTVQLQRTRSFLLSSLTSTSAGNTNVSTLSLEKLHSKALTNSKTTKM